MRAVVFEDVGRVAVRDVPEPRVEDPGDAVVRVRRAAICGTDLHFLHGKAPYDPGVVLGHEAVGVVEAVGDGVRGVRPGDRVVVAFDNACGACWFCRVGQTQLCEDLLMIGGGPFTGGLPGAQAELVRVPRADVNLLPVPEGVDDERALFVGDVLATGVHAAALAEVGAGASVAVVGAGPVGLLAGAAARARGAEPVLVLDLEPRRLEVAARLGLVPVDVRTRNPQTAVEGATGGRGADAAIDAVGRPEAFETAVDVVRRGGTVVVVGVYAGETAEVQLGVYWARALTLRFSGLCPVHARWEEAMAAVRDGRIDPLPLVSHRLPLEEAPRGYELFGRREATKVVLVP
ncbi:MAG TPA: alcohol dehydrogenase catalytic domain-containing protein [Actinomycetota bacterium]|nr:alcohol dehydrogenase catalytic domain-containing protein [Actinomycetota bacterium]